MRKPSDILAGLGALGTGALPAARPGDQLRDMTDFGANPGNLAARVYIPERLAPRPALVVVLHGCTQTAAAYDKGAGWSQLADQHGFILLYPEQTRANNPNLCFNWFVPKHIARDSGEAGSIREMIAALVEDRGIDPARIFVTGLSAGGAMANVMLAAYPDVFAGGAIIGGLAYGTAVNVPQAMERMRGQGGAHGNDLSTLVRRASPHAGPWPTIAIWQGTADSTVVPSNADTILAQWRPLHGVGETPSQDEIVDGYPHRVWRDATGRAVIEEYSITGMGHGVPLDTKRPDPCGAVGPFMLEAKICSTRRIADAWGITEVVVAAAKPAAAARVEAATLPVLRAKRPTRIPSPAPVLKPVVSGVGKVIEDALRAAGLMR